MNNILRWRKASEEKPQNGEHCLFCFNEDLNPYYVLGLCDNVWGVYENGYFFLDFGDGDEPLDYPLEDVDCWLPFPEKYIPGDPNWIPCIYDGRSCNAPDGEVFIALDYGKENANPKIIRVGVAYWDHSVRAWRWSHDAGIVFNCEEYVKAFMEIPEHD